MIFHFMVIVFELCFAYVLVVEASLADVIGTKRPRGDKGKEKVVATSKKQPAPAPRKPGNLTIREPGDAPSPPANSDGRGKETVAPAPKGGKAASQKRARPSTEVPLIPTAPEAENFDTLEVLANCLSLAAAVRRDDLARASTENT